jgi:formylglycine-generating enzyme required for sulfatase activity
MIIVRTFLVAPCRFHLRHISQQCESTRVRSEPPSTARGCVKIVFFATINANVLAGLSWPSDAMLMNRTGRFLHAYAQLTHRMHFGSKL